ncbi:glycolipid transfer protein [Obba rivulosa]|uniref:Glycolipid transfer protein n=1 Tax=Obba rivulosa TaxID=1052685 RepID=A0A8E2J6Y3_9APHY|nr:glycolipid transfer protein [Obba rivulosa]
MAPYFETAKSFADVPISHEGVDTPAFLDASADFIHMFDLIGNGVFGFVQHDLRSNLGGVRKQYEAASGESPTLEKLVVHEVSTGHRHATACLTRLIRGLLFTCQALQNMQKDHSAELHACLKRSYDTNLKHHHTFIIRSAVSVAILAVPSRRDFYKRLMQDGSSENLDAALNKWLEGLDTIVMRIKAFLAEGGYGTV